MTSQNHAENKEANKRYANLLEKIKNKHSDTPLHENAKWSPEYMRAFKSTFAIKTTTLTKECPPICVKCGQVFDKCILTGTAIVAMNHTQFSTNVDVFECSGCGAIVTDSNYKRCL